jgi:hypothetical protein
MTTHPATRQIPCPACSGKCEPDTDTAGSCTIKGGNDASSQPWHICRWLSSAGDRILEAFFTAGPYRIN